MNYLKSFESLSDDDYIKQTIKEICYDITEDNKFSIELKSSSLLELNYVIFRNTTSGKWQGTFLIHDIEDTILRIKDFLGSRFYGFSTIIAGSDGIRRHITTQATKGRNRKSEFCWFGYPSEQHEFSPESLKISQFIIEYR